MTQLQSVFLATTLKSEQARAAQYMELMNLDRVAFFVVRVCHRITRVVEEAHHGK